MRSLGDLNWVLAPLVSFLNTAGGWSFRTVLRRLGIPFAVVLWSFLYYRLRKWWYAILYLVLFGSVFGGLTLPLTLIGDSVHAHWLNWVWIWLVGAIEGLAIYPMVHLTHTDGEGEYKGQLNRWVIGVFALWITVGSLVTLSNTVGFPVHKWFEIIKGLVHGGVMAWLIRQRN